jgi:hypothetical protein
MSKNQPNTSATGEAHNRRQQEVADCLLGYIQGGEDHVRDLHQHPGADDVERQGAQDSTAAQLCEKAWPNF